MKGRIAKQKCNTHKKIKIDGKRRRKITPNEPRFLPHSKKKKKKVSEGEK